MKICGIYKIANKINGKYYLGSSVNIKNRWKKHRHELRHNKHHNMHLQRAWNKYKEKNFKFIIIEEVSTEHVLNKEQEYLDKFTPWNYKIGYNTSKYASGGDLISYNPNRKEIIEKIRKGYSVFLNSMTEKEKHDKFAKYGDKNPNWKGGFIIKNCIKCNCIIKRRTNNNSEICNKCRDRSKENNAFYGKTHSDEIKEKLSKIAKERGNKYNIQKICVEIDGIQYSSFSEAANAIGCSVATIRNRLNRYKKFPNYRLILKLEQPALVEDCNLPK